MRFIRWKRNWTGSRCLSAGMRAPIVQHRVIPNVGHNLPQEDPAAFAAAVWELVSQKR